MEPVLLIKRDGTEISNFVSLGSRSEKIFQNKIFYFSVLYFSTITEGLDGV